MTSEDKYYLQGCLLTLNLTGTSGLVATRYAMNPLSYSLASHPSRNCISNRCMSAHTTIRISCNARFLPTQFIAPAANGMNALSLCLKSEGLIVVSAIEEGRGKGEEGLEVEEKVEGRRSHRSGQNASGWGKKLRGSRCTE